jgi:hypothetical protein
MRPREFHACELLLNPAKMAALDGSKSLVWWPEVGVGYYPVEAGEAPYDDHYFAKYASMAGTEMGRNITQARIELVQTFWIGNVIDVGIGCGAFIHERNKDFTFNPTRGFDVNPAGIEWLKSRDLWADPYSADTVVDAITLWDVLEHIRDIRALVNNVKQFVFVSLPIFKSMAHVQASKHFRRDEHCWYFTPHGIAAVFNHLGFELVEANWMETNLGREDIASFAFRRRQPKTWQTWGTA